MSITTIDSQRQPSWPSTSALGRVESPAFVRPFRSSAVVEQGPAALPVASLSVETAMLEADLSLANLLRQAAKYDTPKVRRTAAGKS